MAEVTSSIYLENFYSGKHSTYVVYFGDAPIRTTVTCDSGVVTSWLNGIDGSTSGSARLIVGLDIESRARRGQESNPPATLQICVVDRCLIFQLLHADRVPQSLTDFMSKRSNVFVGVDIKSDLEKLQSDHDFGFNVNFKDLRTLAAERHGMQDLRQSGLIRLIEVVLHIKMAKPAYLRKSKWDKKRLTSAQIRYAAVDAYTCSAIGEALRASDS